MGLMHDSPGAVMEFSCSTAGALIGFRAGDVDMREGKRGAFLHPSSVALKIAAGS